MTKIMRESIRTMFGGKCAYCGKPLNSIFHVDHVEPIYRGCSEKEKPDRAGEDVFENMFPACPRCNIRKSTLTLEQFRNEIGKQVERLRRDSSAFNLAEDFCLIESTMKPVKFWFEIYNGR